MTKKKKSKLIKSISMILTACMLTISLSGYMGAQSPASADVISELEAKIAAREKEQKELQAKIAASAKKQDAEKEKQVLLSKEIESVESQLSDYSRKIEVVEQNISDKEAEIAQKLIEIDDNEEKFAQRVRVMYMQGKSSSTLATLLSAESFAQFLNNAEILKRISESDRDLISVLANQKEELNTAKTELEAQREDYLATKSSYESKSASLDAMYAASESAEAAQKLAEKKYYEEFQKNKAQIEQDEKDLAAAIAAAGNDGEAPGAFIWPLPNNRTISSGYGWRTLWGKKEMHLGIDIPAGAGTNILASAAGEVIVVQKSNTGYGWRVVINHGGGYSTLYAHTSRIDVSVGQHVEQGDVIAGVGTTGASTGNHLHFEVRVNGKQDNPLNYVKAK